MVSKLTKIFKFLWIQILILKDVMIIYYMTKKLSQPQPWARDQGKGLQGCGPKRKPGTHFTLLSGVQKV